MNFFVYVKESIGYNSVYVILECVKNFAVTVTLNILCLVSLSPLPSLSISMTLSFFLFTHPLLLLSFCLLPCPFLLLLLYYASDSSLALDYRASYQVLMYVRARVSPLPGGR